MRRANRVENVEPSPWIPVTHNSKICLSNQLISTFNKKRGKAAYLDQTLVFDNVPMTAPPLSISQ